MANTEVGTAYVSIIPSAKGFAKELQKSIAKEFKGSDLDRMISDALGGARVKLPVEPVVGDPADLDPIEVPIQAEASLAELREAIREAAEGVEAVVAVGPDGTTFGRDLQDVVDRTEDQVTAHVDVDVDTEPAGEVEYERGLRSMVASVARRVRATIHADVEVDTPKPGTITQKINAEAEGDRLGNRIGDSTSKGFLSKFVSGVAQSLGTSPLILGLGSAIGVALVPVVSAALTGGLIGGAGVGLIGLGALILREEPEVKNAANRLSATVSSVFKSAAIPLIEPIADALEMIRWAVIEWGPQFREMFELIAPAIKPLTEGLIGMVSAMLPGFTELIRQATPFLISLADQLPRLGEYIGAFFQLIDGGGPEASLFFSDLITVVGGLVLGIGAIIRVFTELYPWFRTISGLGGLTGLINVVWNARDAVTDFAHDAMDALRLLRDLAGVVWRGMREDAGRLIDWVKGIPGRIRGALGSPGAMLAGIGRAIMGGLINGIKAAIPDLRGTLSWVTSMIPNWKGPMDTDRRLLEPSGSAIMGGLIRGIHSERRALESELGSVTTLISGSPLTSPAAGFAAAAPAAPAPALLGWAPGATSDPLLDAIQELIRIQSGGDVQARLGTESR